MVRIQEWMQKFVEVMQENFGQRIVCIGLQGSYGRGEASEDSDIDVVLILDELHPEDLEKYDTLLSGLSSRELVCGFVSGKRELESWEKSDLFQFYYDTLPVAGSLDFLLPKLEPVQYENPGAGWDAGWPEMVCEPAMCYTTEKKQGEYTLEDYYALPEERRAELIDGVIYDMAAPSNLHQMLSGEIFLRLKEYIRKKCGACIPAYSPMDVQLDCDDRTMVQPDVLVLCDREKMQLDKICGAPDLVVEILSESTKRKDSYLKLMKYEQAGVREYWLVDPDKKRVIVYDFAHEECPALYTFQDQVPVQIFGGECRIDFSEIYAYVQFLYEKKED